LTVDDAIDIQKRCGHVVAVSPMFQNQIQLKYRNREVIAPLLATTPSFRKIRNWYPDDGRFFGEIDLSQSRNVCVLGRELLRKIDADERIIGQEVSFEGRVFTVIGLLEKKGAFLGKSQDDVLIVPLTTARKIFGARSQDTLQILAQADRSERANDARDQIEEVLRDRHGLALQEKNDFEITTQDQALSFFNRASRVTTFVLAGVVSISLLVGGIGIMNIMLVSVTERTREIGILKALGSRDKDILLQFLIEALLLSLIGGTIGVVLGVLAGYAVSWFSPIPSPTVPIWAISLGFLFSAGVGVFFGMYPAVKAARLNPIEALRYE
jgi:putative ABC transport system permease protein